MLVPYTAIYLLSCGYSVLEYIWLHHRRLMRISHDSPLFIPGTVEYCISQSALRKFNSVIAPRGFMENRSLEPSAWRRSDCFT